MKKIWKILLGILALIVFIVLFFGANLLVFSVRAKKISEGEAIRRYDTDRAAVLVIDIQEGTSGTVAIEDCYRDQADKLIGNTNRIARSAMGNGMPVVYIRNEVSNPFLNMMNSTLAKGREGSELDHRLEVVSDYVITKNRGDAFSNPELDNLLAENRISQLYVTGLDAAYCVNRTIQAARNRKYTITVISDAVVSYSDVKLAEMLDIFQGQGLGLISTDDFVSAAIDKNQQTVSTQQTDPQ